MRSYKNKGVATQSVKVSGEAPVVLLMNQTQINNNITENVSDGNFIDVLEQISMMMLRCGYTLHQFVSIARYAMVKAAISSSSSKVEAAKKLNISRQGMHIILANEPDLIKE